LLIVFVALLCPAGALAETKAVSLEQANGIVKNNFTIPEEYSIFSSGYENYGERKCWSLNWISSGELGGSFTAQVDAETGEIFSMQEWKPGNQAGVEYQVPAVTIAEA